MGKRYLSWLVLALMLLVGLLASGAPAGVSAQSTGEIAGTVTNAAGSPLSGIEVWLYRQIGGEWTFDIYTTTDSSGEYAFPNLAAENYRLHFRDWSQVFAYEYYDNASRLAQATDIPVGDGQVVTIDVQMEPAGRISGTLTGPGGQPLDYGYVFVHEYESADSSTPVFVYQITGTTYEFGGLPSGDYIVHFTGQVNGGYFIEFYQDHYDFAAADPVPVVTGLSTDNINGVIGEPVSGAIDGVVRNNNGDPLAGIEVSLYAYSSINGWQMQEYQNTGSAGAYSFTELLPGTYRLHFFDRNQVYAFEFYDNAVRLEEATDIPLAENQQLTMPDVVLADGGRIAGTLTAPDGSLLEEATVWVFLDEPERGNVLHFQDATGGTYAIGGLATASYHVQFTGRQGSTYFMEYYDDRPDWETADPVAVTAGQTTGNINAIMGETPGGSVTGSVTDLYGRAFDLTRVLAYVDNGGAWELFKTQELNFNSTEYEITLPPGTYRLAFEGESFLNPGNPTREVYDDVPTLAQGTDITVTLGETVRGIDAELGNYATGSISGQVTDESGNPLPGIEVYIYNRAFRPLWDQMAVTDANGAYTINGLWPEAYFVEFYDPAAGYIYEYYDDAASRAEADRVLVNYGAVTGIDAGLAVAPAGSLPGGITGTITDESGNPVSGISVTVAEAGSGDFAGSAYTASDGSYRVRYLLQGTYTVKFSDENGEYHTEWYDDAGNEADADPVSVTNSTQTGGIDAALSQGGRITGTVTDIDGDPFPILFVNAFQFNSETQTWELVATGGGLNITAYELAPLPAGTYRIGFRGQFYSGNGYSEIYDNVADIADGTDVVVIAGETTSGIDAVLGPDILGEISGTVTDGNGNPLAGIIVRTTDFELGFLTEETTTAADGTYIFDNVLDGIYYVEFADPTGAYPGEWYNDAPFASYATPITVDEAPVTGIDAALDGANGGPGGGSITGRVTLETNGDPVPGVEVRCYAITFDPIRDCTTTTDANGDYFLGGFLPADAYLVKFEDPNGSVAEEYYDDVRLINDATPIPVTLGVSTTGIDAALTPAGYISGTLTGPDGLPLEVQSVNAFAFNGTDWEFVNGATWVYSDDPHYLLGGLPTGTYRIRFSGGTVFNPTQYVEVYDNVAIIENGTDVPVVAGQVTPEINAVLGNLFDSGITGRVTDQFGNPLDFLQVTAFTLQGSDWITAATTLANPAGDYLLDELPPGTYRLEFMGYRLVPNNPPQMFVEYYDDQPTLAFATDIILGDGELLLGVDAQLGNLAPDGGINGAVMDTAGNGLAGMQVTVYMAHPAGQWVPFGEVWTDAAGEYTLFGLADHQYRICFSDPAGNYAGECYDDVTDMSRATDVVVQNGQMTMNIMAWLAGESDPPPDDQEHKLFIPVVTN